MHREISRKKFLFFEGGIWLQWVENAVLCQHITGPRRRAGKDDPIAAEEKNMRGPALLAALSMVLTAVPAALAVETAAGTPPAVTEAPIRMCRRRRGTPPSRPDLKQDGAAERL